MTMIMFRGELSLSEQKEYNCEQTNSNEIAIMDLIP